MVANTLDMLMLTFRLRRRKQGLSARHEKMRQVFFPELKAMRGCYFLRDGGCFASSGQVGAAGGEGAV